MPAETIDPLVQGGLQVTGVAGISFVVWKLYALIKNDVKSDNKGDNVDARIAAFTATLQTQLDKAIARSDSLSTQLNKLQAENAVLVSQIATAQARAEFLAAENTQLRADLTNLRGRLTSGEVLK